MSEVAQSRPRTGWLRILGSTIVCLAILAASAGGVAVIYQTEPTAQTIKATRKSAALVETVRAERGTYAPRLIVLGTVEAAQQITLSPRVSGQVTELADNFVPGGMVQAGDLLLQIDPADFENALSIRQSELEQANASLKLEQARQSLAKKELSLLEGSISESNRALVLREPQFASIQAEVSAAEAAVERARLDFERSTVFAPFDAQILSRSVNVGSQVGPGDELAQLAGIEEYWVRASVPVRSLRWIQFPDGDETGSPVILRNNDAWGKDTVRRGSVSRMIGTVDEQSRLARVLITVPDPLGRDHDDQPPLILNTLIETEIEGRPIEDVVRIERQYIRDGDTVWVMKNGELQIRNTEIAFRDAQYAYVSSGLDSGDAVVTTTLATVAEGIPLRELDDQPVDGDGGDSTEQPLVSEPASSPTDESSPDSESETTRRASPGETEVAAEADLETDREGTD